MYNKRMEIRRILLLVLFLVGIIPACSGVSVSQKHSVQIEIRNTEKDFSFLSESNRVFILKEEIDLKGKTIKLGNKSSLFFKGGKLKNGLIVGNQSKIKCQLEQVFDSCTFSGSWRINNVYPEWFGARNDGKIDCTDAIQRMFDFMKSTDSYVCLFQPCDFKNGEYYLISKTIYVRKPVKIKGAKAFVSSKTLITYKDNPTSQFYKTDGIAFHFIKDSSSPFKKTDICINMKVHAKPFFFSQMDNVYVHDCYVSTFTGDTSTTNGILTFWYAFQCDELSYATFKNIHIDQPTQPTGVSDYNSSDGIHLSGGCHDIVIDNVYGQAGDDFIAMNANENHSGDIYNIDIKNCRIGETKASVSGIRFYGCTRLSHAQGKPQLKISNVSIKNCYINTTISPCIFFTNNPYWRKNDTESLNLAVNDIRIRNCTLRSQISSEKKNAIWLNGVYCDGIEINRVRTEDVILDNASLVGIEGKNDLNKLMIKNCTQGRSKQYMVLIQNGEGYSFYSKKKDGFFSIDDSVFIAKYPNSKFLQIKKGVFFE